MMPTNKILPQSRRRLVKDIEFCLTANQTDVVPILKDGVLYEISKLEKADAQL